MSVFFEVHRDLPREAPGGDAFTRQAFETLPSLDQPAILDIGCGPGAQTLALANLSDGDITAIDTHAPFLDCLRQRARAAGVRNRIHPMLISMMDLPFPNETFDIIWSEGAIYIIGVEAGLQQWQRCLKPGGYLVFSELVWLHPKPPKPVRDFWQSAYSAMQTVEEVGDRCHAQGYRLLNQFVLPTAAWENYYRPMENRIQQLRQVYAQQPNALQELDQEQQEIEIYRQFSDWYSYAFFVLQLPIS
ncbi:class I SAM-dependent methyltransferase [Vacuolonema iberomarrocanum]|uniref:class I SAM-dependent methyltransferase n=1 Tax=Vacuolonema iberomarrocanum TaxID=3454632 RepID=UPI001A08AC33|nr:methyltransferase domain-containing protein [filamentous cyanobacterium LEGE 07170]